MFRLGRFEERTSPIENCLCPTFVLVIVYLPGGRTYNRHVHAHSYVLKREGHPCRCVESKRAANTSSSVGPCHLMSRPGSFEY